jgi:hypothetical protein
MLKLKKPSDRDAFVADVPDQNYTIRSCAAWVAVAAALLSGCCTAPEDPVAAYPFTFPLSSPGEKFGGLPPAVQTSIRAQVGGADMRDIRKMNATPNGRVVYEIIFAESYRFPPLYVQSDGSVLFPDMTVAVAANRETFGALSGGAVGGLRVSDLPINVANTIYEKAPTAEVAYVNKIIAGDSAYYEVSFKGKHTSKMLIADDGTLLEKKGD